MKINHILLSGALIVATPVMYAQTTQEAYLESEETETEWEEIAVVEEGLIAMRLMTQRDAGLELTRAEWRTELNQVNEVRLELEGERASLIRKNEVMIQQNADLAEKNEYLKRQNDLLSEANESVLTENDAIVEAKEFLDEYDEAQVSLNQQLLEQNERKISANEAFMAENERMIQAVEALVEENEEQIRRFDEMLESVESVADSNEILISED